ncbi:hypothetical protein JAAARDRAFT_132411 [Jaapia argillacea MUCL 33604]|uniref:J domain-containing protein n=1 Tax=Jaapia argillacea MUCL 33604 TaxID=933084 RepID=A0A067Q1B5_9AGAM|nr:hypothetical protein JAAARDRAFT_132411 [Jaapia argillacea MUCL 33604]
MALSSSAYAILRLLGWTYLPDVATYHLLNLIHNISLRIPLPFLRNPPPSPRTNPALYSLHYRLTFAFVTLTYLLYNLVEASRSAPRNLYEVLGVGVRADEGEMKGAFRAFAKKWHPDRVGVGKDGEGVFMEVREAFEKLRDPAGRWVYDRFGPDALNWTHCTNVREYLRYGLMQASGYHIVTAVTLLFFTTIGKPSPVAFWRYLLFVALLASELSLILNPTPTRASEFEHASPSLTSILSSLFPQRLPYQHILFLHQLFIFLSVALSRVVPVLLPGAVAAGAGGGQVVVEEKVWRNVMEKVGGLVGGIEKEVSSMIQAELTYIKPKPKHSTSSPHTSPTTLNQEPREPEEVTEEKQVLDILTKEMENMIIESRLKKEASMGPLRTAWETAINKGRERLGRRRKEGVGPVVHVTSPSGDGVQCQGFGILSPPGSVSPVDIKAKLAEVASGSDRVVLPSPRPSPEPPVSGAGSPRRRHVP